jgi:NAD dependent epimerase/dehydratase family enzyme
MKIVVAGGTGFLGTPLVSQLRTGGNDVSVLTCGPAAPGRITWSPDGTVGPWATAIDGADIVINLAGESIAGHRWTETHKTRIRVILLRSAPVLESDGGVLPQMARPFRFFVGGPVGPGTQYCSWIHRDDWIALVKWALETNQETGPLNLAAPTPVTNREFCSDAWTCAEAPGDCTGTGVCTASRIG